MPTNVTYIYTMRNDRWTKYLTEKYGGQKLGISRDRIPLKSIGGSLRQTGDRLLNVSSHNNNKITTARKISTSHYDNFLKCHIPLCQLFEMLISHNDILGYQICNRQLLPSLLYVTKYIWNTMGSTPLYFTLHSIRLHLHSFNYFHICFGR